MAKIENKICAVTVTYGNRWRFLSQVINRLLSLDMISHVVVVNNGSDYSIEDNMKSITDPRLVLIDHAENKGSAGGYYAGIKYAHQKTDADFIWLLDDDNLPDAGALDILLKTWSDLNAVKDGTALFSLRTDRTIDLSFARGADPYKYYLLPDSFLGFSVANIGRNKVKKIISKFKKTDVPKTNTLLKKVKMPYVPYGGFFFHRAVADKIGYPDERFYLYVDDEEYTYRVTQGGGSIWLIPESQIKDIDTGDTRVEYVPKPLSSKILDLWNFRMYYRIRNSVYFHHKISTKSVLLSNLNKAIFMAKIKAISIISGKQAEYKKFVEAVNEGLAGELGKANPMKL